MIFKEAASKMEYSLVDLSEILPLNNQSSSPKLLIRRQVAPFVCCILNFRCTFSKVYGIWLSSWSPYSVLRGERNLVCA